MFVWKENRKENDKDYVNGIAILKRCHSIFNMDNILCIFFFSFFIFFFFFVRTFIIYAKSGKDEMWMFTTDDPRDFLYWSSFPAWTNGENRAHGTQLKARGLTTATATVLPATKNKIYLYIYIMRWKKQAAPRKNQVRR